MSRSYDSVLRLSAGAGTSRAGRHSRSAHTCDLVYRITRPLTRPVQPPAPRIIHNTVHQTVVHLHQTTHQHIRSQITAAADGHGRATLLLRQTAAPPAAEHAMDPSRPVWTARRLLRILSTEGARRTIRPFFQNMFRGFLERERESRLGKPAQSLLLVQTVLGRRRTLDILRRFYRTAVERLEPAVLYSLISRRYIRSVEQTGEHIFLSRYTVRERSVPDDLRRLPAARRVPPPPEPQAQQPAGRPLVPKETPPPKYEGGFHLNDADFHILVGRVAEALGRQKRLEALRRGGM